jgi:antitoxin CcdA
MINTQLQTIEEEVPVSITCDVCEATYDVEHDEAEEFIFIHEHGGFGSVFGDGSLIEATICQHCFKEKLGEYLTITEEH